MSPLLETSLSVSLVLLGVALLLAFVRVARGPTLADRAVALDLMAATVVAMATAYAVRTGQAIFVDVALAIALVSFLGTLAFARYVQEGDRR